MQLQMIKSRRMDTCKIILLTSAVWFFIDLMLMYFVLDNGGTSVQTGEDPNESRLVRPGRRVPPQASNSDKNTPKFEGILGRFMKGLRFGTDGPGEMGRPVFIEKSHEEEMKELFTHNQFNLMASDRISLNRSLPDYRMPQCRKVEYSDLPATSIIIVFHNEAWSTLLRTLHSVVNRSPRHLLKQIILVDDKSDREYLREPLAAYIERLPVPTKLIHLEERSGLIQARLRGSAVAEGPVMLFLDAHIEVTEGWLEPLLDRIKINKKTIVAPIIDVISDDTFEYVTASDMTWGGYNWHLNFRWFPVPNRELERRQNNRATPIETPTIAGGLFAIDRKFFYDLGAYDEGMRIWGGENLEISFRAWMCGGKLEISTCSHVGHVFRKQTPYTFPGGTANIIHGNSARTAEVWMDEYKDFFYMMTPGAKNVEIGDLTERKNLRKKLKCKSFRWFIENVYIESPIPLDYYSLGEIKSPVHNMCLDTMGRKENEEAGISPCHDLGGNQAWSFTAGGELRTDELCLGTNHNHESVVLERCHKQQGTQLWQFDSQSSQLRHVRSGFCLTVVGQDVRLEMCNHAETQQWVLQNYQPSMHRNINGTHH